MCAVTYYVTPCISRFERRQIPVGQRENFIFPRRWRGGGAVYVILKLDNFPPALFPSGVEIFAGDCRFAARRNAIPFRGRCSKSETHSPTDGRLNMPPFLSRISNRLPDGAFEECAHYVRSIVVCLSCRGWLYDIPAFCWIRVRLACHRADVGGFSARKMVAHPLTS